MQKSLFSFVAQRLFLSFVAQRLLFPFSLHIGYYNLLLHTCSSHKVDIYQHHDNSSTKNKECKKREVVRFEPQNLNLVNTDPTIRVSFEQVGCMRFCEKVQGYNVQLTKQFSLKL
jgi:hypothetical protein